jgi:hypothetical protein
MHDPGRIARRQRGEYSRADNQTHADIAGRVSDLEDRRSPTSWSMSTRVSVRKHLTSAVDDAPRLRVVFQRPT